MSIEKAARAIQREYLATGHPCEFSESEVEKDFVDHADMYMRMARAASQELKRLPAS